VRVPFLSGGYSMDQNNKPYTTGEIAGFCSVTINAVKKWIAAGKLNAFRTPGGHYRVHRDEFLSFLERYKLDIKARLFPETRRVLIVDDERDIREFVKGVLESMDSSYEVETASDGYEALIKVGDFKPELVILDIRMPNIDGFEVCRRIKEDRFSKDISILAVTAYGEESTEKILRCGADYCLPKPLRLKDLKKKVQKLLK
jgi:excisionase family DNA binding protein